MTLVWTPLPRGTLSHCQRDLSQPPIRSTTIPKRKIYNASRPISFTTGEGTWPLVYGFAEGKVEPAVAEVVAVGDVFPA
jgi:hypothetical protein